MKKNLLFALLLLLFFFSNNVFAQRKVKVDEDQIVQKYDRNSISVLATTYSDASDVYVIEGIKKMKIADKFDINAISSNSIAIPLQRSKGADDLLDIKVNEMNVGQQIVAYWLNYEADGKMNDTLLKERSLYNATDQEKLNDQAVKVSTIAEKGEQMIANSYIVVFDVTELKTSDDRTLYYATANAYVYHIEFTADNMNDIYQNMWIYATDDANIQSQKKAKFTSMLIPMTRVNKFSFRSSSDKGYADAVAGLFDISNLSKMEKKIEAWQVNVPIYATHPIVAKAGKKEGLHNGDRFRAYSFQENKNGELIMVKKGYVRATTIIDNRDKSKIDTINEEKDNSLAGTFSSLFSKKSNSSDSISTKKTNKNQAYLDSIQCSRFYQISGVPLKEGVLLKQDKDLKIGISAGATFGGISLANVRVDYLGYIHNSGIAHYALVNFGFDYVKEKWPFLNISLGYGCGLPVSKAFEFQPFVLIGGDSPLNISKNNSESTISFFVNGGLRFSVMPVYHFQIFIQADYSYLFKACGSDGRYYDGETVFGWNQGNRFKLGLAPLGLSVGVRCTF